MTPPGIFILIPAYNVGEYLAEAIESVIAQSYRDWTLLILDDCSTDNTASVAASFVTKDNRVTYIRNERNLGMVRNWNKGITFCKSTYFAKLDGDDKWHPRMIESALAILDLQKDVGIVFTKYVNIDHAGKILDGSEITLPDFAKDKSFSCIPLVRQGSSKMLSYSVLRQGLSVMRSKIFKEVGAYRFLITEDTQASSDTEFYFRVGCHYQVHCIDRVMYYYRVHPASISAVNQASGLAERKMYEVKSVINDYYFAQRKIDIGAWRKNKAETDFLYLLYLNYQSRQRKEFFHALKILLKLIGLHPIKTLNHFFRRLKRNNDK